MPKVLSATSNQAGFSVVEILLAVSLFGALTVTVVGAIIYGNVSTSDAGERGRAALIAEEGVEAVRNIRDNNYTNLSDGTYGLAQSAGQWALSGASDTTGVFNRQITIAAVDAVRKTVTARVTWPQGASTASVEVVSRLSNWRASIKSWVNGILAGSLDQTGLTDAVKVATSGNYAYYVRSGTASNFIVVNITNPAAPTLAGALTLAGTPTNITVNGNYAYVTNTSNSAELQVVNITNPAAPSLAGTYDAAGNGDGRAVAVSGNYAYLARATNGGSNEFQVVNVANPAALTLAGSYGAGGSVSLNDVYISGNYAYVTTDSNATELVVINIATPALLTPSGSLNLAGTASALAINGYGATLFISQANVLRSVSIATPTAPVATGAVTVTGTGTINDIAVDSANGYAFLGTTTLSAEFQVVNVANPASMSVLKTIDVPGLTASSIGGLAYNSGLDTVAGGSTSDTQEAVIFTRN